MAEWTISDSRRLYNLPNWGAGFFDANDRGHVRVNPRGPDGPDIDLFELVKDLERRGMRSPMLVRFSDILASRVQGLAHAFRHAMDAYDYGGRYRGVYPIKVNQQRHVVEEIVAFGAREGVGLEAGSKPELLIALAVMDTPDAFIICNGYKDRAYVETALLAQRLGRTPVIVIDRFRELELIIKTAKELHIRPHIGVRARLSTHGAGRWTDSTGSRSKFGLTPDEIVAVVERLRSEDMLDCLELLHFHIGSQITSIQAHKDALREGARIFVGLHQLGVRPRSIDVGGGLGVDYDGSKTHSHSSANYSEQEYANDVVAFIQEACEDQDVPVPDIITESGRAMVAHHSVLIFNVLEVNEVLTGRSPERVDESDPKVLHDLAETWSSVDAARLQEAYHDAQQIRDEASTLFALGYLKLADRARVEHLFLACGEKILGIVQGLENVPDDLADLEKDLADTYYGNFSVFQSAPDHWAVKQLFPVIPIHRLNEEPTRRGILADLTCDSDGKIDQFIDPLGVRKVLELHPWNGRPYYMGVFLVGAYQEILGDLHNLFGDTDAVHVRLGEEGGYSVEHVVEGDEISDVLRYVQYDPKVLVEKVRLTVESALRKGQISLEDSTRLRRSYARALRDYTYLSLDD
jgi:arginine decarboxylase